MIETTERGGPALWPTEPVRHARPGLSTVCSLLAILSAVPLAVVVLADRLAPVLHSVVAELPLRPEADRLGRVLLLAGAAACLAAPVAAWLARVLPPWVVLLTGLLTVTLGYWRGEQAASLGDIDLARILHGVGAGCLLAATAALVGAASARMRPLLAGAWAAALVGTVAVGPWLVLTGLGPYTDWQDRLRPYPWLLALAAACGLALAAASVADHRPRLHPRWIDLAALLPLVAGVPAALVALSMPRLPGSAAVLSVAVLLGALVGIAAVAFLLAGGAGLGGPAWSVDGRGAVGAATAAVAFVTAVAVGPTVAGLALVRQYAMGAVPVTTIPRGTGWLLGTAAAAGVLAAVAGAVLPEVRRRAVIVAGLLVAALGALALLPASAGTWASVPGLVALTAGCGLALGSVLRSVGPLATAVAGALVAVALPAGAVTRAALQSWQSAVVGQRLWLALLAALLLGGAAVAAVALAISRSRSTGHAG